MNTRSIIATVALSVAATGAFAAAGAGEAHYEYPQAATSLTSRADVQAQLLQARGDGAVHVSEATGQGWAPALATRSRDAVRAEAAAALASGEIRARTAESNGFDGRISPANVPVLVAAR